MSRWQTRRSRKARTTAMLLWLVLGVAMNVAVAWLAAGTPIGQWGTPSAERSPRRTTWFRGPRTAWNVYVLRSPFGTRIWQWPDALGSGDGNVKQTLTLPGWCAASEDPARFDWGQQNIVEDYAFGWPSNSLRMRVWPSMGGPMPEFPEGVRPNSVAAKSHGEWFWLVSYGPRVDHRLLLPLRPLWPGFALSTLFYAALAWALWQVPLALRRRSRSKRGACVRCGYDLKGIAAGSVCPECGTLP